MHIVRATSSPVIHYGWFPHFEFSVVHPAYESNLLKEGFLSYSAVVNYVCIVCWLLVLLERCQLCYTLILSFKLRYP